MTPSCWRKPSSSLFDHFSASMRSLIRWVTVAVVSSLFPVFEIPGEIVLMCSGYANSRYDLVSFGDLILDVVLAGRSDPEDFEGLLQTSST